MKTQFHTWVVASMLLLSGACSTEDAKVPDTDVPVDVAADTALDSSRADVVQDVVLQDLLSDVPPDLPQDLHLDLGADVIPVDVLDAVDVVTIPQQELDALKLLFPLADRFEEKDLEGEPYYEAFQLQSSLGVAFVGRSYGFDGEVVGMTAVTPQGVTVAVEIVSQWESWWFSVQYDEVFWNQFKNVDTSQIDVDAQSLKKGDPGDPVDAVSGATFSSQAVISGFWQAMAQYMKYLAAQ